jgi:hypothetical protein
VIEWATVPVRSEEMKSGDGGKSVYIGNGFVLTAARCLEFDTNGGIAQRIRTVYSVDRFEDEPLWCSPVCIDR